MRAFAYTLSAIIVGLVLACESDNPMNNPPRIIVTFPNGDATITAGDTIALDMVAYDPDGDDLIKSVQIESETFILPAIFCSDTAGVFRLIFRAGDLYSSAEKRINLTVNEEPVCNIIAPVDGDTLVIGDIHISVEASDRDGNIESVEFYIDDVPVQVDTESPYSFTDTTFWHESGICSIKAVAVDNVGDRSECEITINLAVFFPVNPNPDTINVPSDYSTIQEAVDNAQDGDVILIADGEYDEHVSINHPLIMVGNGENTVVYDHTIGIQSNNVILKDIKVAKYSSIEQPAGGFPAITIRNSSHILIDNVIAIGGPFNFWFDPDYPYYPICTDGGPGTLIMDSSNITVQNSDLTGGIGGYLYCWIGSLGGPGSSVHSTTNLFFVSSSLTGVDDGDGIIARNHSCVGVRDCTVEVSGYGEEYVTDGTSTIIFP